jgi:hypothetical protein
MTAPRYGHVTVKLCSENGNALNPNPEPSACVRCRPLPFARSAWV